MSCLIGGDLKTDRFVYTHGKDVIIRSLKNPLKVEMYSEHSVDVTVARISPSGYYCASADVSGKVRIWDLANPEQTHILKNEYPVLGGPIRDLQWSEDSKRIVVCGEGKERFGAVFLFDTGASVGEISGHTGTISSCDFKQTRPYRVATGASDNKVGWFEGPPFKFKHSQAEATRFINCVRFAPDGSKLIAVSSDQGGRFYDGKEGTPAGELNKGSGGHTAAIYCASWSPDSKQLITSSGDKSCKIWDSNGQCLNTFNFGSALEMQQLGCLWHNSGEILSVSLSGEIFYLDPSNPSTPKKVLRGHNQNISALTYHNGSNAFFSGSTEGLILRWDAESGQATYLNGANHTNQILRLLVQGDSLVSLSKDDTVRITPIGTLQYGAGLSTVGSAVDLAVGNNSAKGLIVVAVRDGLVMFRDGKNVGKTEVPFIPSSVAISVDGSLVAVGGEDHTLYLFSVSSSALTQTAALKRHKEKISRVAFSPDGKFLAAGDSNREIIIWDLASKSVKIDGWVWHTATVTDLAWSPDSLRVASASVDGHVYIWNVEKPDVKIPLLHAHRGGSSGVVWLSQNVFTSTGIDCCLKTWTL